MTGMPVVRYAALAALVVWIGGLLDALAPDAFRPLHLVGYACGAIVLIALVVIKLVGPPPHAFPIRVAIVALMLLVSVGAHLRGDPPILRIVNLALGLALLAWYARE
jgi:hypothetical protein